MIIYTNCLGNFVFDNNLKLAGKKLFSLKDSVKNTIRFDEENEFPIDNVLLTRYPELRNPDEKELGKIRAFFKSREYFPMFKKINTQVTMEKIRASVNEDNLIINTVNNVEELERVSNVMTKRLREWYGLYFPELSEQIKDNEAFTRLIFQKNKKMLMKEIKVKESMGSDIDTKPLLELALSIYGLFEQKKGLEAYLDKTMKKYCPNLRTVAGSLIGAKLLKEVGSLRRMATITSSTIQLLGAEKALFRHIRNKKAKPPKHGHIVNHPIVAKASKKEKGKAARIVADKISMAAKVDYFKGKFIGDKLRKELENKFK